MNSALCNTLSKGDAMVPWSNGVFDKADRRSGKTTSGNGQAWSVPCPRGQWKQGENEGNWLWWGPNDPRG